MTGYDVNDFYDELLYYPKVEQITTYVSMFRYYIKEEYVFTGMDWYFYEGDEI